MKITNLFIAIALVILTVTCRPSQELVPVKARQIRPSEVNSYHSPAVMKIAWYPYKDLELKKSGKDNWVVVKSDSTRQGAIPVILITYPDSGDSIWLEMNTDNELLGRLMKHTLMTQIPITEPIGEYLETAKCSKCHPGDVNKGFE